LSDRISLFLDNYSPVGYKSFWTDEGYDKGLQAIKSDLEIILNELSNSRRREVLGKAEEFPVLINSVRPFKANSKLARACMYIFPVGVILWLLSLPFELRISNDLKNVQQLSGELIEYIHNRRETAKLETA